MAAGIDGQWNGQLVPGKKAVAPPANSTFTLMLKSSQDGQVTGRLVTPGKKKPKEHTIRNARLDGNRLTFTTVQGGKKSSVTFSWQVTIEGDQMSGTRTREGARHGQAFKARRSG
jgi:hypothetical protein